MNYSYDSQDNLLSDEEAKEIKKLLSPPENDQLNTSDWMSEILSIESNYNINNQRYILKYKYKIYNFIYYVLYLKYFLINLIVSYYR